MHKKIKLYISYRKYKYIDKTKTLFSDRNEAIN